MYQLIGICLIVMCLFIIGLAGFIFFLIRMLEQHEMKIQDLHAELRMICDHTDE